MNGYEFIICLVIVLGAFIIVLLKLASNYLLDELDIKNELEIAKLQKDSKSVEEEDEN